jgi:polyhydroxybutyrate depolymerase
MTIRLPHRRCPQRSRTTLLVGLLTAALATAGCSGDRHLAARARSQATVPLTGNSTGELVVEGRSRRYLLHIPPGFQPGSPVPLVLNLHGLGWDGAKQARLSGMSDKADREGFIVVYPEGEGSPQRWNVGSHQGGKRDLAFLRALIDHLERQLSIDPTRVYATGISNGGGLVNRLGCELADRIAAIAPVSGDYQRYEDCHPARPVPVVAFHGTGDPLIPYQGNRVALPAIPTWAAAWAARNGCDATPAVTYHQGDVTGQTWDGCRDSAIVTLYTIAGGKHDWPGRRLAPARGASTRDIDATDVMWAFFVAHPMP